MVTFFSVLDAIQWCIAVQRSLLEIQWPAGMHCLPCFACVLLLCCCYCCCCPLMCLLLNLRLSQFALFSFSKFCFLSCSLVQLSFSPSVRAVCVCYCLCV